MLRNKKAVREFRREKSLAELSLIQGKKKDLVILVIMNQRNLLQKDRDLLIGQAQNLTRVEAFLNINVIYESF
jgi:hypothetical protein